MQIPLESNQEEPKQVKPDSQLETTLRSALQTTGTAIFYASIAFPAPWFRNDSKYLHN